MFNTGETSVDLKDILIIAIIVFVAIAILNGVLALFAVAVRLLFSLMYLALIVVAIGAILYVLSKIF